MNNIIFKGALYTQAGDARWSPRLRVPRKGAKVRMPDGSVGKFLGLISPKSHGGSKEMAIVLLPGDVAGKSSHSCNLEDLTIL